MRKYGEEDKESRGHRGPAGPELTKEAFRRGIIELGKKLRV